MISPIGIKFFEEYNYNFIENYIQKKIDKYTMKNQFGFKKKSSTYQTIKI